MPVIAPENASEDQTRDSSHHAERSVLWRRVNVDARSLCRRASFYASAVVASDCAPLSTLAGPSVHSRFTSYR